VIWTVAPVSEVESGSLTPIAASMTAGVVAFSVNAALPVLVSTVGASFSGVTVTVRVAAALSASPSLTVKVIVRAPLGSLPTWL